MKKEILKVIQITVSEVLNNDSISLNINSNIDDIEGWDSLAHVGIVTQIEQDFEIKFTLEEVSELTSIKKIVESIERKYKQK